MNRAEARRLAIQTEADALGVPAFLTPTWRALHARKEPTMPKTPTTARQIIRKAYNGHPNIMTPDPIRYGWKGPYAFEISEGEGFRGQAIFGVTVVRNDGAQMHALSKCVESLGAAEAYVKTLGLLRVYKVSGEERRRGAIGAMEPFSVEVGAPDREAAMAAARDERYAGGREHVLCKTVDEVAA